MVEIVELLDFQIVIWGEMRKSVLNRVVKAKRLFRGKRLKG